MTSGLVNLLKPADEHTMNQPMVEKKATLKEWIGVWGAIIFAFMAILDISIANSSLRDIQGTLGASLDEGTWITTSYLIGEVLSVCLTGWFAQIFSQRRLLIVSAILFIASSMACGLATSLPMMVIARFCQGLTGGAAIPLATQAAMGLPPSQRAQGLYYFSLASCFAPMLGPVVGGWVTFTLSWQFSFFINLIPGLLMLWMIYYGYAAKPMNLKLLKEGDWVGIFTLAVGLGTLTFVLEEGTRLGWMGNPLLRELTFLSVVSFAVFFTVQLTIEKPLINLQLFRLRKFAIGCVICVFYGIIVYGTLAANPGYLFQVQGYSALQTGQVMMFAGSNILLVPFMPALMRKIDKKWLILAGLGFFSWSCLLNSSLTHFDSGDQMRLAFILRAIGNALVLAPVNGVLFESLQPAVVGSAASIVNGIRLVSGSVGIALISTFLSERYHFHFLRIAERMPASDPEVASRLSQLTDFFASKAHDLATVDLQAKTALKAIINRESLVMAYSDCFLILGLSLIIPAIAILLLKKNAPPKPT